MEDLNPINKGGRPSKKDKFDDERQIIVNKLNNILGINNENKIIYLYDIDNDTNKQNEILALRDDIRRVFTAGNWPVFSKNIKTRQYLSLMKSVYKDMGINFVSTAKNIQRNGKSMRCSGYIFTN